MKIDISSLIGDLVEATVKSLNEKKVPDDTVVKFTSDGGNKAEMPYSSAIRQKADSPAKKAALKLKAKYDSDAKQQTATDDETDKQKDTDYAADDEVGGSDAVAVLGDDPTTDDSKEGTKGKTIELPKQKGTSPPEQGTPVTNEQLDQYDEYMKKEFDKDKTLNPVNESKFKESIEPDGKKFDQTLKQDKQLSEAKEQINLSDTLKDAGVDIDNPPFPRKYVDLMERLVNTESSSVKTEKISKFIEGAGAGQIRSQAGEILTMMLTSLPDDQANAISEKMLDVTKQQDKSKRILDPSWVTAAMNNREATLKHVRNTYGEDATISQACWDTPEDATALGMKDYKKDKGFSTDVYYRVEKEGRPVLLEASLKKDKDVFFINLGAAELLSPAPPEGKGIGVSEEELSKGSNPPPESTEYSPEDYAKRRDDLFKQSGKDWDNLSDDDKKSIASKLAEKPNSETMGALKKYYAQKTEKNLKAAGISAADLKTPEGIEKALNYMMEQTKSDKPAGPADRLRKTIMNIGDDTDNSQLKSVSDAVKENHTNFAKNFPLGIMTNKKLRGGILGSIRNEFPIKAVSTGEEIMAIGDMVFDRPACKKLFGTDDFTKIQEKLTVGEVDGRPALVYSAGLSDSKPVPIANIGIRERGIGYTSMTLEMGLHKGLAPMLKKANDEEFSK